MVDGNGDIRGDIRRHEAREAASIAAINALRAADARAHQGYRDAIRDLAHEPGVDLDG